MPEIPSIGQGSVGPINRTVPASALPSGSKPLQAPEHRGDRVELSRHAELLDRLQQRPDVRNDIVKKIRDQILQDTYESPQKVDESIERFLEEERLFDELRVLRELRA